ncbi:MAG: ATP-dependent DNA helicase RecQ [Gemmatimonadota bacterium]|jgi:ATP-dependent DNA helicase RecQ
MQDSRATVAPRFEDAIAALRRTFGYPAFRGVQERAVQAVLEGRDVLVLMPTGGGKSLCFQVPALVLPGLTLVVSPLISLMKDQVDALERRGVSATFVNSSLPPSEMRERLDRAVRGELRLLYIAPERFDSADFRERLPRLRVARLVVDEAHCVSEWGRDFRPAYLRLGRERRKLGCPLVALTATATPEARADIVFHLGMRRPVVLAGGFDRPNLAWRVDKVRDEPDRDRRLLRLVRRRREGAAIVYAPTRRRVDALADLLNRSGVPATGYHAGAAASERQRLQDRFMAERSPVLVATNAFGMGIDKPNVRLVVHHAMPGNLEAYYQEAGRAGRDGAPATCILLYAPGDRGTHEFLIDQSHPDVDVVRSVWVCLEPGALPGAVRSLTLQQLARRAGIGGGARQALAALRALENAGRLRIDRLTEDGSRGSGGATIRFLDADPTAPSLWASLRADRRRELDRLLRMERYAGHRGCRRAFLLRYFGETPDGSTCHNCDRCQRFERDACSRPSPGKGGTLARRIRRRLHRLRPLPTGRSCA